jgi:hypothetical protein
MGLAAYEIIGNDRNSVCATTGRPKTPTKPRKPLLKPRSLPLLWRYGRDVRSGFLLPDAAWPAVLTRIEVRQLTDVDGGDQLAPTASCAWRRLTAQAARAICLVFIVLSWFPSAAAPFRRSSRQRMFLLRRTERRISSVACLANVATVDVATINESAVSVPS